MQISKGKRAQYTLEFKIEALRLVRGGRSVGAVSQVLAGVGAVRSALVHSRNSTLIELPPLM